MSDELQPPPSPQAEVTDFRIDHVLVSRTDRRGVILAGNDIFETVSGFTWDELHNAPQKIIRHPDMPKGVFWLFWHRLLAGQPVGAFVKNRSKGGRHYWVFAFVAPQGEGFLSVRIKPTEKAVKMIAKEYAALLTREQTEGLSPEESGHALLARLAELGFKDYGHFMADMAGEQSRARAAALGVPQHALSEDMLHLTQLWRDVRVACTEVYDAHCAMAHTPANLRVQAAHLMGKGVALSEIASNFTALTAEITDMMTLFINHSRDVESALDDGAFLVALEHVMHEVVDVFKTEKIERAGMDLQSEIATMMLQRQECFEKSVVQLREARKAVNSFNGIIEETTQVLSGLSVAKVMCEIENAHVGDQSSSGVSATIAELDTFQVGARKQLYAVKKLLFQAERLIKRAEKQLVRSVAA